MTLHWFHSLTRHNFHFPISHFCFEKICFLPQVLHHHNKSPAHYQVQVRIWLFGWCEQFLSKCLQPRWWEMTKWRFFQSPRSLIEDTGRRCCLNLNWSTCHFSCIISPVLCAKSGLAKKMPHIPCHSPPVTIKGPPVTQICDFWFEPRLQSVCAARKAKKQEEEEQDTHRDLIPISKCLPTHDRLEVKIARNWY